MDALGNLNLANDGTTTFAPGGPVSGEGLATLLGGVGKLTHVADPLYSNFGPTRGYLINFYASRTTVELTYPLLHVGYTNDDGFQLFWHHIPSLHVLANTADVVGINSPEILAGVIHQYTYWLDFGTQLLHLAVDGVEVTPVSAAGGFGPIDPAADFGIHIGYAHDIDPSDMRIGSLSICHDPIPDATQRSLLFGGLPFSQWDSGGSSGGVTFDSNTHRREGNNPPMQTIGAYKRGGYARR